MQEELFSLQTLRHSASHVMAQAVQTLFPDVKLGIGPAIDDGFYYDFELSTPLTENDLIVIEKEMKKIIKQKQSFTSLQLSRKEAEKKLKEMHQTYKLEIINELNLSTYSFFSNGPFTDLCRGPHIPHTKHIKAFKLLRVSGAYWKGSEKNTMLQRIYGTAFFDKESLNDYLEKLEEAKKRDHRIIGKQQDLFSINEDIGGGLVLWHPKGAFIRNKIENIWKEKHYNAGYELIYSPHVGKAELWKISGHLENYNENMYSPMPIDEQDYFIRPMNCPFHILIYQSSQRSYRQLPIRYAELGTVYRYERSGVLHGLFRVRGFTQDDAHIICTKEQVETEIQSVLSFCKEMLDVFGFKKIKTFISTRPEEKAVGSQKDWEIAQEALENAVKKNSIDFEIDHGGGAFYGPKIDIKIEDSIGRQWQCSTIQFDFNLPERFNMSFINSKGEKERPIMIHRALLGSLERFFGILIEHYAGKFPLWLSPIQTKILTIHESGSNYAKEIEKKLKENNIRVDVDLSKDKISAKIRNSIAEKVPYLIIIGKEEIASNTLSVRQRDTNLTISMNLSEFIERLHTQ
jgi:threonyl-tRNA synthetase